MTNKVSLNALHHQCTDWLRELEFYKQELEILKNRLGEVAAKNSATDILAQVEHFQNKFIMLREQHDELRHEVNLKNENVLATAKEMPTHIDQKLTTGNDELQEKMKDYSKGFSDTRFEFNRFAGMFL